MREPRGGFKAQAEPGRALLRYLNRRCPMPLGILFWTLMIIWFVFGVWWAWPGQAQAPYAGYFPIGNTVLLFILFLLLGWHAFGPPIHG